MFQRKMDPRVSGGTIADTLSNEFRVLLSLVISPALLRFTSLDKGYGLCWSSGLSCPTRPALITARYLRMRLLTSRATRFRGLGRLVADYFGRSTAGTYLGPDCGSGLLRGGRGDRVIEDGDRRAEL